MDKPAKQAATKTAAGKSANDSSSVLTSLARAFGARQGGLHVHPLHFLLIQLFLLDAGKEK